MIEVWNKVDLLDNNQLRLFEENSKNKPNVVMISATKRNGCDTLLEKIDSYIKRVLDYTEMTVEIPPSFNEQISWLRTHGHVISQKVTEDNKLQLLVGLAGINYGKFESGVARIKQIKITNVKSSK